VRLGDPPLFHADVSVHIKKDTGHTLLFDNLNAPRGMVDAANQLAVEVSDLLHPSCAPLF
jgi:hypothetical protein